MIVNRRLILTRGLPFSGKTTWAKEYCEKYSKYLRISLKDLDKTLCKSVTNLSFEENLLDTLINLAFSNKYNVIVDDCHLEENDILKYDKYKEKAKIIIKDFRDVDVNLCVDRSKKYPKKAIVEREIRTLYKKYIKNKK